jgi:hypothetical protein
VIGNYIDEITKRIDWIFANHPEIPDHRKQLPWLKGYLGNPNAGIWFLAENPSLTTAERIKGEKSTLLTVETQWAVSQGDRLFRESLVKNGFKDAPWDSLGGWRCYLTDVIKQEEKVNTWHKQGEENWLRLGEIWAEVLAWELEASQPRLVVVMGKRTRRLVEHLALTRQLRFPRTELIQHYSYIGSRPRGKQPPMDPDRIREYQEDMRRVAKVFSEIH